MGRINMVSAALRTDKQTKIGIPITGEVPSNGSSHLTNNLQRDDPTKIYGIVYPLIKIGDIVIPPQDLCYFKLDGRSTLPSVYFVTLDSSLYMQGIQQPGPGSEIRVEILPPFEGKYKKINLTFKATRCKLDGGYWKITGVYKIPSLYSTKIQSFGNISTYNLCKKIASACELGFASNVKDSNDKRSIYCANQSYLDILNQSMEYSETISGGAQKYFDMWIDFWDTLVFADIYERYNSVDLVDGMKVWVAPSNTDTHPGSDIKNNCILTHSIISNSPTSQQFDLYAHDYKIVTASTTPTNMVYTTANTNLVSTQDKVITDNTKLGEGMVSYSYLGECNNETYNYLESPINRGKMSSIMRSKIYKVELNSQALCFKRGDKVNFLWFDVNDNLSIKKDQLSTNDNKPKTNINLPDMNFEKTNNVGGPAFRLNSIVSGQYYIIGNVIEYETGVWRNTLDLVRPSKDQHNYLEQISKFTASYQFTENKDDKYIST